jgi:hypothetical protein
MQDVVVSLTDQQAVNAVRLLAEAWLEGRGRQAYGVMQNAHAFAERQKLSLPDWASGKAPPDAEGIKACRVALKLVLEGNDGEARNWAQSAIQRVKSPTAQVIDPLTLAIGGTLLIGLVLAARVKHIGPGGADFEPGLPDGLDKLLKAAGQFFSGLG